MLRPLSLFLTLLLLGGCMAGTVYQAYPGDRLPSTQAATVEGVQLLRQDWLNRYMDAVRFAQVDDLVIDNSVQYHRLEITPGNHDLTVYFYWDMGSARGLAPALVSYAATRENLSRTLSFNAEAGMHYRVLAEPVFSTERQDITTLSHVNFWIEDEAGNEVVSRQQGRYPPQDQ